MEKKLKDLTIEEFMLVLADSTGAPGGGSMCALAGAIGASGLIMVADLTASLKRFAHEAPFCTEISTEAKKYIPMLQFYLYLYGFSTLQWDTPFQNLISGTS